MIDRNAGFVVGPSGIATALSAIDAADTIEITTTGGGAPQRITSIAVWARGQDWAVISATPKGGVVLPIAANVPKVGDRCYSMETGASGVRVLTECTVAGRGAQDPANQRLIVQFLSGRGVTGSPVVNEVGEVIGLIAGSPLARYGGLTVFRTGADQSSSVVPVSSIRSSADPAVPIEDLKRRGVLMLPVSGRDNILRGGFAREILKNPLRPMDEREQFSAADGRFFVFLTWDPKERVRGALMFRVFDENNQPIVESKPRNIDLKPGTGRFSQWEVSVPQRPGSYRTDVLVGDVPMWRGVFRVVAQRP